MDQKSIFSAASTGAGRYAKDHLRRLGLPLSEVPGDDTQWLLLDVPSFNREGYLRGGGSVEPLLGSLPENVKICGGNLDHPALAGYETVDLLKDEEYLCQNAHITAECALDVALPYLTRTVRSCPVLILGWGRIGKCLGSLLKNMNAEVTVAARNPGHRAMLRALGFHAADFPDLQLSRYRLIYNTIPHPVLSREQVGQCREDCVKIELASQNGIEGDDVIVARGLPGIHMPESSGELIARTFLRLCCGR